MIKKNMAGVNTPHINREEVRINIMFLYANKSK